MGKMSLCVFLMLVPMRGTFEGMEGVVSDAQPMQTPPDTARISHHPGTVTVSDRGTPLDNKVTTALTPVVTTAAPAKPAGTSAIAPYMAVLIPFGLFTGFCFCYNMIAPMLRSHPVRAELATAPAIDMSSTSSDDDNEQDVESIFSFSSNEERALEDVPLFSSDEEQALEDVPSLSRDQAETPEDALIIQGMSSTSRREPVVKFRRARPEGPKDPVVSSPPGDSLDLLYQDQA